MLKSDELEEKEEAIKDVVHLTCKYLFVFKYINLQE